MTELANRRPHREPTGNPELDALIEDLRRADVTLRERIIERRVVHQGRYMTFEAERVERPDGLPASRDIVVHPGAVAILAVDEENRILLVRQYRLAAGGAMLEIPAGTLDRVDGGIEDPDDAARRELEEETGCRADNLERLTGFWTAPGFSTEYLVLYLATGLHTADGDDRLQPDEDELLEPIRLDWRLAVAAVEAGVIEDAKSVAGIMLLARRLNAAGVR